MPRPSLKALSIETEPRSRDKQRRQSWWTWLAGTLISCAGALPGECCGRGSGRLRRFGADDCGGGFARAAPDAAAPPFHGRPRAGRVTQEEKTARESGPLQESPTELAPGSSASAGTRTWR